MRNWFCWCGRCARGRAGSARIFARKRRRGHQHFPCVCLCGGSNGVRRSNSAGNLGLQRQRTPRSVYLAAAVAVAEQKGVPIFKIYGQDVQDADDISVPQDVAKKLVLFAQCALAVSTMRNKAYLSVGNVCMGIGASIVDQEFFPLLFGHAHRNRGYERSAAPPSVKSI